MDEPQVLFRRLSVYEIYSQTLTVFMKESKLFLLIAGLICIIMPVMIVGLTFGESYQNLELLMKIYVSYFWLVISNLFNILGSVAMARATAELYLGQQPLIGKCLMEGLKVFFSLLCAWLIVLVLFIFISLATFSGILALWPSAASLECTQ